MDVATYLKFLLVLVLVIGLIFGLAWILRRMGVAGTMQGVLGRKRRLTTVETALLDGRHRLRAVSRAASAAGPSYALRGQSQSFTTEGSLLDAKEGSRLEAN